MNVVKQDIVLKKVGDLGKPGSPGHAVELEVMMSRRSVLRIIVPFLVATLDLEAQNRSGPEHEMAIDNK